jgi:hypothetical protein
LVLALGLHIENHSNQKLN